MNEKIKVMTNYFEPQLTYNHAIEKAGFEVIRTAPNNKINEDEIRKKKPQLLIYEPACGLTDDYKKDISKFIRKSTRKFPPSLDAAFGEKILKLYISEIPLLAFENEFQVIALTTLPKDLNEITRALQKRYGHRYLYLPETSEKDLVNKIKEMTKQK